MIKTIIFFILAFIGCFCFGNNLEKLKELAKGGDVVALNQIGMHYLKDYQALNSQGDYTYAQKEKCLELLGEAQRWFSLAARKGSAQSLFYLGNCWSSRARWEICFNDSRMMMRIAKRCYWESAELGCVDAQFLMAESFSSNKVESVYWYRKAAKQGCIKSKKKLEEIDVKAVSY